jgi:hypothetical protein
MQQLPETPVSTLAHGPAPLPGPGDESVQPPAPSDLIPAEQPTQAHEPEPPPPQRIPRWLVRVELFLRVMLRMYIGLAICYAPWSHTFWDQNPFFLQFPSVGAFATNGAVRGLVSGLGLLNLWIAFQDALKRGRQ